MALVKGCLVRACGLQRRPDLNGALGLIVDDGNPWDVRHRLKMLTIPQRMLIAIRPANLQQESDNSITVCVCCKEDFWSWATHGGYAGWRKVSKGKYACPSCPPAPSTSTCTAWASAGNVGETAWASSGADGNDAWATSSAGASGAWATSTAGAACEPPASLAAEAAKVQETPLLLWLRMRKMELPVREARFRVWKQLMLEFHPDKLNEGQDYDRLALAVHCSFMRTAKGWFLG